MNIIPAYRDFSAGEISPLMRNRQDVDTHNAAVKTMRNMVPDAHGPAKTRDGTEHLVTVSGVTKGVLKTLNASIVSTYFSLVITDSITYVFDSSGAPHPLNPTLVTPYLEAELDEIYAIPDPDGKQMWVLHPNHLPARYLVTISLVNISYGSAAIVSPPASWVAGAYPSAGTIFRGRLWLAYRNKIWASVPQQRGNFTIGTTENDAFEVEMEDSGDIRWMSRSQGLVVGTDAGEYIITSQGNVIYIGDIAIDLQSGYGSKSIEPIVLGDKLGFISVDGKKLYATQYDDNAQTWVPIEVSFFSEHITEGEIKDFLYHPHPDNLAWFTKEDGDFISALYNRSVNVYGWSRHDTNGTVISMSRTIEAGIGGVTLLVDRNGTDLFLEVQKDIPLDSFVHYSGVATVTITGLGHLEGMEVHALTDDYYGGVYTVASGQITLDQEASDVYVGLSFEQELELLPLDKGSQRGSGRTHLKRYKDIFVGILNSYYPEINGETPQDITPDVVMDTAPELITGMVNITDLGYDRESNISIKQSLPFPLIVTGIFGTLTQEKL